MNRLGFFPSFIFAVFCLFCCFFWGEGCQRAYIGGSGGLLFNLLVNPRALKKSVIFLNQPSVVDMSPRNDYVILKIRNPEYADDIIQGNPMTAKRVKRVATS